MLGRLADVDGADAELFSLFGNPHGLGASALQDGTEVGWPFPRAMQDHEHDSLKRGRKTDEDRPDLL